MLRPWQCGSEVTQCDVSGSDFCQRKSGSQHVMRVCLAGPSEGLGYGRTSPCREEKARAVLRHGSSSLKSTKTLTTEPGPFVGERIDPALPLESQW